MKATLIVIQNDADHVEAKALVARLMQSDVEADRARGLAQARLTEAYEKTRWPRKRPALRDLLAYLMDQHGLTRADLIPILGTASRVSEVLGGKRELSMTMIQRLRDRFHVPADLLIPTSRKQTAA
jgi:HTH-type transcriptional regulator/antitoxin HigA